MTSKGNNVTLDEQIADLGLPSDLADALRGVVMARSVETNREAGYISVRPSGRHIAAYFNKKFVDIAVEPTTSKATSARHPGTRAIEKTTATHYLRVPEGVVDKDGVVALVGTALDWRERGHQWSGSWTSGGSADLAGEICAICNTQIAQNGTCYC